MDNGGRQLDWLAAKRQVVLLLLLQYLKIIFIAVKMRFYLLIPALTFLCISLCSCPYSSIYTLDEEPGIYVEDALLGKWAAYPQTTNSTNQKMIIVSLTKKNDTEYNICFSGYPEILKQHKLVTTDSITGTAFMSTVDGMQFLNIKISTQVFIAQMFLKNGNLSLLPLAEHFTAKMIFDSQALRNSVSLHYKTRVHPIIDEDFCLKDMIKLN